MPEVKPIPDGYTAITPYLIVDDGPGSRTSWRTPLGRWSGCAFPWGRASLATPRWRLGARW